MSFEINISNGYVAGGTWIDASHAMQRVVTADTVISSVGNKRFIVPKIVRDFQSVISKEARQQILELEGKLPTAVMACVGGGSNAMGMFYNFINDKDVRLIGCEAAGRGIHTD